MDENGQITKRGYTMAQFAKYIRSGYQRVDASNPTSNVYVSAYKGNGKVVIVAVNMNGATQRIKFNVSGGTTPVSFVPQLQSYPEQLPFGKVLHPGRATLLLPFPPLQKF